jgi:hypothetical protein
MRSYLLTSGIIFFLIVIAHAARIAVEGLHLATEADFLAATALALGMAIWACVLFRRKA